MADPRVGLRTQGQRSAGNSVEEKTLTTERQEGEKAVTGPRRAGRGESAQSKDPPLATERRTWIGVMGQRPSGRLGQRESPRVAESRGRYARMTTREGRHSGWEEGTRKRRQDGKSGEDTESAKPPRSTATRFQSSDHPSPATARGRGSRRTKDESRTRDGTGL